MVVATNIVPWVLTVHMVIAALMIGWQILIISVWKNSLKIIPKKLKIICFFGLIFFLFQIILGTQVRQIVDQWIDYNLREELRLLDFNLFLSHRSLALILIIYSFIIGGFMVLKKIHLIEIYIFFFCVLLEAVVGKILADYNLPIFFQPVHLVLAMVCFGCLAGVLVNYKTDSN